MSRASVVVREATDADASIVASIALAAVRQDARLTSGAKLMLETPTASEPDFGAVLANPDFRTIVAVDPSNDEIVALAVMSEDQFAAIIGRPTILVHYLVVVDHWRHRGIGRELLADITRCADELGAQNVVVGLWTDTREINRYFAKIGFSPVVQRRIAPVATLRRTLGLTSSTTARESLRRRR